MLFVILLNPAVSASHVFEMIYLRTARLVLPLSLAQSACHSRQASSAWHPYLVTVSAGTACGSSTLDALCQLRLLAHLYNALLCAQAITPLPIIELFLVKCPRVLWLGGRPAANFLKTWFVAMGMGAVAKLGKGGLIRTSVKGLTTIRPGDVSQVFLRAVEGDLSDVIDQGSSLPSVLSAIRAAFDSDELLGVNLTALASQFIGRALHDCQMN